MFGSSFPQLFLGCLNFVICVYFCIAVSEYVLNIGVSWRYLCIAVSEYVLNIGVAWRYLCIAVSEYVLNIGVAWRMSYTKQELLKLTDPLGSLPGFNGVLVAHHFYLPSSCVPNVASFSKLSILDCPFFFL
jgi:hypothetical protein